MLKIYKTSLTTYKVENIEAESNHVLTENFHLSYFNPLKSMPSKSYSVNTLLAQPIYVAMGIALSILLFGILFLTTALLIYRKHKHFHISNCHAVCNYSCHNGNAVTSPTMESVNHKSSVGISENLNRYQNLSQLTTMYPNQNSVDQPLLLNGISSNESMNPSTEYRSLPSGHGDSNWLKPVDNVTSHEKKENICKENLFTYCCCCYPYRDNVVPTNHIHDNNTTSKRFTSFRNSSMLNKRTPVSIDSNNNSNISGEHFHPAICEESELSLNTENQKHDPSSVSTPLFSLHSASLHQISDLIEHRKLNSNNHSNNNKPLLYNNQNTFTWIQNQQSQLHQQSRHQKFQQLNSYLVGNQEDQQQTHSMINELNGNNSNSSCLNEINNKGSPDYELIKTTTNYKSNENELDWTVDAINSFSHRKNDTDSQNVDTNWKVTIAMIYALQKCTILQQQTLAPIHLSDLTFPHLPPPPSYPPPPQQHQQQPQQFIEALNSSNQIIQNKTSPFVELHRLDMLLQRQRGTGKTSSGGEDSKTIESEQSELNHTWKLSGSRESSSGASTAILGQRSSLNNNNNNRNNSRFLEYSPDFNKLTGRKVTERDFIGLATFRKQMKNIQI
ncbi:unnamed protein product [Heterobilharzia americana]|nr:unnamed protein product [Heterobilharzia americana]